MVLWKALLLRLVTDESRLAEFEGSEIDSGVGKHAHKAHGEATVGGADEAFSCHLFQGVFDELVAAESVGFDAALHTEF